MANPEAAREALEAFVTARGESDTDETDIIDLITDLCRLASIEGLRPSSILITAKNHWETEEWENFNEDADNITT